MATKAADNARVGAKRETWPGDPEGTVEARIEKERKENEAAQKKRPQPFIAAKEKE